MSAPTDQAAPVPGLTGGLSELTPPHDLDAERSVLGAMLLSPAAVPEAMDALTAADFYSPAHAEIFTLITELFLTGSPVDLTTVAAAARRHGMLPRLRGGALLADLISVPANPASLSYYAGLLLDHARMRALATATLRGYQRALDPTSDPATTAAAVAEDVVAAATGQRTDPTTSAGLATSDALALADAIAAGTVTRTGLPTGYPDLDALTLGIHPGQLILIAGRPAMGKSVAVLDIARHVALAGHPVLLCSLEMSTQEVGQRLLAAQAGIPLTALREGTLSPLQRDKAAAAAETLAGAPLDIDESTALTVADLRARAAAARRRHGRLALIVVDYLQLLTPLNPRADKHVQIGDISRALKVMAKETPVLAASQLNRGPEARPDKRPLLSDLRDSGSLEQDADVAILLHRDDAYDRETPRAGEIDLIVAKQRNGPTGTVTLAAQLAYARLSSMYHAG